MPLRKYPTLGCCGIDCGLCPRYYTAGESRCPGCGGENFENKHPSCAFVTCCVKKHGLNVCAECGGFPCEKFDKETGEHDSFVTHRRVMANQHRLAGTGVDAFVKEQRARIIFLETALKQYDDGKSKSFYCLAAALLTVESLQKALEQAQGGANLRSVLTQYSQDEGQELKLRK